VTSPPAPLLQGEGRRLRYKAKEWGYCERSEAILFNYPQVINRLLRFARKFGFQKSLCHTPTQPSPLPAGSEEAAQN